MSHLKLLVPELRIPRQPRGVLHRLELGQGLENNQEMGVWFFLFLKIL